MPVRTVVEHGTKDKRSVAYSLDWPGWERGAKSAEVALATLEAYRPRYRSVAALAGMASDFDAAGPLEVVEDRVGTGSTDFWGISFSPSSMEHQPLDEDELERRLQLLEAAWATFDAAAARVTPQMRTGPRGGGRDRDHIVRHMLRVERLDFAKQVGVQIEDDEAFTLETLRDHRAVFLDAMRAYNAGKVDKKMRSWTLPFLIRHSAFHALDHAWEMEDKDLSGEAATA
jgi:hypothetical protein